MGAGWGESMKRQLTGQTETVGRIELCLEGRAWTDRKGKCVKPGGAVVREVQKRTWRCLTCRREVMLPPPYFTAMLCDEVMSAENSQQLGEKHGIRPHLIRITLELLAPI